MGFWTPDANAPRDLERLAAYVDQQLGSLSRVLDTFQIARDTYVPVWTHSVSTDPVIGNGTLKAHAFRWGEIAFVQLHMIVGSTTTFEAAASPGQWEFSVPWACDGELGSYSGGGFVLDSGSARHVVATRIVDGSSIFTVTQDGNADFIRKLLPMTWATGDELVAAVMYPVTP